MPYITKERRKTLDEKFSIPLNSGELNYVITKIVLKYIDEWGKSYADYNAVIGVLECAKLELYRRRMAEYEDNKKDINGDVY